MSTLLNLDNYLLVVIGPLLIVSAVDKDRDTNIAILIVGLIIYMFTIGVLFIHQKYYVVFLLVCIFIRDSIELHKLLVN